ncbi:MAG: hypothetical protein HC830_10220 [Bacteroidetes bacterium]|nr:hypothetical protein [Bacteroidota bacterium]
MNETTCIDYSIHLIEEKLNQGPCGQWTAYHFSVLSREIFEHTGKTVSDSTLKRFFGRKDPRENYNPQVYTKNAIAEYLKFKDWHDLAMHAQMQCREEKANSGKFRYVLPIIGIIGTALLILGGVFLFSGRSSGNKGWLRTGDTARIVPYTATFQYDVSKIEDSVFIDFGRNILVSLPKDRHTITEFYKEAGVFYPKIITRNAVIDSLCIRNYCSDWQGGFSPNDDYRKFIPFEDTAKYFRPGCLYVNPRDIIPTDPAFATGIYVDYRLMKNWDISLDSVHFEAIVKNSPAEGGKLCYDTEIWLLGTGNNCKFRFVEPGCYRYGQLQISEKIFNGRFDDLSALARDIKSWKKVGIKLQQNVASIFYENELIINEQYIQPLGKLIGIYFRFYGTGSVKQVEIKDNFNKIIYHKIF